MSCNNTYPLPFICNINDITTVTGGDATDIVDIVKLNDVISIQEAKKLHEKLLCDDCKPINTGNVIFDTLNNLHPSQPMTEVEAIVHLGGSEGLSLNNFSKLVGLIIIDKTRKNNIVYDVHNVLSYKITEEGLSSVLKENTSILIELNKSDHENSSITILGKAPYFVLDKLGDHYRILSSREVDKLEVLCPHIVKYNELLHSFLKTKKYEFEKISRKYVPIVKEKLNDYLSQSLKDVKSMSALYGLLRRRPFARGFVNIVVNTLIFDKLKDDVTFKLETMSTLEYEGDHIGHVYIKSLYRGVEHHKSALLRILERSTSPQQQLLGIFEKIIDNNIDLILSQKLLKPIMDKISIT